MDWPCERIPYWEHKMIPIHKQPNTNSPSKIYVQVMDQQLLITHLMFQTEAMVAKLRDSDIEFRCI
jgi:hypothetical protein